VLDRVGDVGEVAVDSGLLESAVEETAGRADEGVAGDVLLVAGLFADEDDARRGWTFTEDGLRAGGPEIAGFALGGCGTQPVEGAVIRDEGARVRRW
jgi:hypothetical protein